MLDEKEVQSPHGGFTIPYVSIPSKDNSTNSLLFIAPRSCIPLQGGSPGQSIKSLMLQFFS